MGHDAEVHFIHMLEHILLKPVGYLLKCSQKMSHVYVRSRSRSRSLYYNELVLT